MMNTRGAARSAQGTIDGLRVRLATAASCLPFLVAMSGGAQAETAQQPQSAAAPPPSPADLTQLQEVTVTAERRAEDAQTVPISITTFTAEDIARNNIQGIEGYFDRTPNVSFISNGSRDRKDLSIRGISNELSDANDIKASTIGFYIDDFNVATATSNPEIVDIDRIEILRGPQGTYFGRNAVGGAINVTTNQPTDSYYAEGSFGYSRFNTTDEYGIVNVPVIPGKLAVRLVARQQDSDGDIRNINPIGGGNWTHYDYTKAIVRVTPTDQLTIDLTASATGERDGMRDGVPSGALGATALSLYPGNVNVPVPYSDGVGFYPTNTHETNFNRPQTVGTDFWYGTMRVKYSGDDFDVTNIAGYLHEKDSNDGDVDGSSLDLFYEHNPHDRDSTSEELRVQSKPGTMIDWTFGALWSRDRGSTDQITYTGTYGIFGLAPNIPVTSTLTDGKEVSQAMFGDATWHITDALAFTAGLRMTHDIIDNDELDTSSGNAYITVKNQSKFYDVSPRFNLDYKLDDSSTAYATISKGFKAGGVQISQEFGNGSYAPEKLWNYEVGYKAEFFDRRLRLDASAFYMDWSNLQVDFAHSVVDASTGAINFVEGTENAAAAHSQGIEFDIAGVPYPGLTLAAGGGYLDAQFDNYKNAYVDYGPNPLVNLSGATLPNSPRWTLNASAEYDHEVYEDITGFVRGEWFYRGSDTPVKDYLVLQGFPWRVPSYNQFNLRAGIERDWWSVTAFVENLSGKEYYTNAYEKAFLGGVFLQPVPETFGVRVTFKYD
jgi:iron complex outermembrane receptor protein